MCTYRHLFHCVSRNPYLLFCFWGHQVKTIFDRNRRCKAVILNAQEKKTEKRKENLLLYKNIIFFLRERKNATKKELFWWLLMPLKNFIKILFIFFSFSVELHTSTAKTIFLEKKKYKSKAVWKWQTFLQQKTNQCHLHFIIIFTKEKNVRLKGFLTNHCFGAPF